MREKQPWRSDLLDTLTPELGRYVPVGLVYYGDSLLPAEYHGSLFVPEWGARKIAQYPLEAEGDTFKTSERLFLSGEDQARPVGVAVGRGGRLFATICHMAHNETSPIYRSELVMITRADDCGRCAVRSPRRVGREPGETFLRARGADWSRRYRAHVALTRRGPEAAGLAAARLEGVEATSLAMPHWIWLAAADSDAGRNKLIALTRHSDRAVRVQAVRALARFGGPVEVFVTALRDSAAPVRLAGWWG